MPRSTNDDGNKRASQQGTAATKVGSVNANLFVRVNVLNQAFRDQVRPRRAVARVLALRRSQTITHELSINDEQNVIEERV
jgi:hypothetical protein